jgi:tetratricopeptide (TPR) repeat protein
MPFKPVDQDKSKKKKKKKGKGGKKHKACADMLTQTLQLNTASPGGLRQGRDIGEPILVCELFSGYVDPAWIKHKENGNTFFAAKKFDAAIECYTDALHIALGPFECMLQNTTHKPVAILLAEILAEYPSQSAHYRFARAADNTRLTKQIAEYLPCLQIYGAHFNGIPNKPAAVCLANRSLANFRSGQLQSARDDALQSSLLCPEYVKAHVRIVSALKALGEHEHSLQWNDTLAHYQKILPIFPFPPALLVGSGWLQHAGLTMYQTAREDELFKRVRQDIAPENSLVIHAKASLVGFEGGQYLMQGYVYTKVHQKREIDASRFERLDSANEDDLDIPPHGQVCKF